jgi:hypothetical protein
MALFNTDVYPHFKLDADGGGGASSDPEPNQVDAAEGGETTQEEHEKLPLHLHERGKELVAEKNRYKSEAAKWKALGDSPEVIAEKLHRLAMWESAEDTPSPDPPKKLTQDELSEKAKRDYARQVLEDLAPEIKEISSLKKEVQEAKLITDLYKTALEEVAWETTEEIAEELGMEPDALAGVVIPVLKADPKLRRMFHTGKVSESVREAVEMLKSKVGGKAQTADIAERAQQIKKAQETSGRVPKTHAPGKPEPKSEPQVPKTLLEAQARVIKRLG